MNRIPSQVTTRFAVMGNPVHHSLSPLIHDLFAKQTNRTLSYEKFEINLPCFEQQVLAFFANRGKGLNITPRFMPGAFIMSEKKTTRCLQAQAANTLWLSEGKLQADNTDGIGLMRDLSRYIDVAGKKILLLGAGGAARGILGPLLDANPVDLVIANRSIEKAHALKKDFPHVSTVCGFTDLDQSFDLIINATSAGLTEQNVTLPPIVSHEKPLCYDLTYRVKDATPFVAWARSQYCHATDGLGMLVEQAAEAFFIWHHVMPDTAPVFTLLRKKCGDGWRGN